MDDTTQSRISDVAAAETRKRRSSILKSQRPPRTPFCELEFNVCTPTDTAKSRRVSFSRRTGVAEFARNEATTTWKNFYEEHNKSLESSGTDTDANNQKQSLGHLGKSIFDQFEEVEAVDFIGTLNPGINISTSINNINFTQLECTDSKLTAPRSNFELSAFTEQQSKLFSDDLAVPSTGVVADRIDVNFSTVQPIGENDDLDEIQKDLQRQSNAVYCHGPFRGRQNSTEYIEIDLNMTHVAMKDDKSDMSITDTIHSPKVQDVSKSCTIDRKVTVENDWVMDKENIAINPYTTPRESVNFAVNEESDNVLVFDGKKLIVQTEKENYRQTLLPNYIEVAPQRKTIVLNCNDDLPNFIDDAQVLNNASGFVGVSEMRRSVIFDGDMSITHPRSDETQNTQTIEKQQRMILYDDNLDNIFVTQANSNVIAPEKEKRRTILYDNDTGINNISITQAVPSNIIDEENRKTVQCKNNNSNISITQAVPAKVILSNGNNDKRRTIVYENEGCNISMTQVIPVNIIIPDNTATKRRTIVFENDNGNVSITQAIPDVVIKDSSETRKTVVYEDKTGDISVTKSISSNVNITQNTALPERKRTVIFERDNGDISVTQALSSNIILPQKLNASSYQNDINMTQVAPTNIPLADNVASNRRRTVLYEDDLGNLSITRAVTSNQVIRGLSYEQLKHVEQCESEILHGNKEDNINDNRTIIERDDENISMTQAVYLNQILPGFINKQQENLSREEGVTVNKRMTIVFDHDNADISMTQAVPMNQVIESINEQKQKEIDLVESSYAALHNKDTTGEKRTVAFEKENSNASILHAIKFNQELQGLSDQKHNISQNDLEVATNTALHFHNDPLGRTRTIMYDDDENNISITQAIPANVIQEQQKRRTIVLEDVDSLIENEDLFLTEAIPAKERQIRRTISYEDVDSTMRNKDIFLTEAIPAKEQQKRRTIVYEDVDSTMRNKDIFLTKATPAKEQQKRRTIVYEDVDSTMRNKDIFLTEAIPAKEQQKRRTIVYEDVDSTMRNKDIFLTKATPAKEQQKRRTIVYEDVDSTMRNKDIFLTKATPAKEQQKRRTIVYEDVDSTMRNKDIFLTKATPAKEQQKRRTIVYEDVDSTMRNKDIFLTEAIPAKEQQKRRTIVYEDVDSTMRNEYISLTESIPAKEQQKRRTIVNENLDSTMRNEGIFLTEAIAAKEQLKSRSIVYKDVDSMMKNEDISLTEAIVAKEQLKRRTIVYKDVDSMMKNEDISLTEAIVAKEQLKRRTIVYKDVDSMMKNEDISLTEAIVAKAQLKRTIVFDNGNATTENKDLFMEIDKLIDGSQEIELDVSMPESNDVSKPKRDTIVDGHEMSIDEAIHYQVSPKERQNIGRSADFDETANLTLSKPIPAGLSAFQYEMFEKSFEKDMSAHHSMLHNLTNVASDILVYHAETISAQSLNKARTENLTQDTVAVPNIEQTYTSAKISNEMEQISHSSMKTNNEITTDEQIDVQTDVQCQESNEVMQESKLPASSVEDTKDNAVEMPALNSKNLVLNDLLDMSHSSMEGMEDKILMTDVSELALLVGADKTETEPLFFITEDSDESGQTDETEKNMKPKPNEREKTKKRHNSEIIEKPTLPIENKDKEEPTLLGEIKNKLAGLIGVFIGDQSLNNHDRNDTIHSLDMESKGVFIGDQSLHNHDRNDTIHSLDMESKGVFIGNQSLNNHNRNDTIHSLDMESKGVFIGDQSLNNHDRNDTIHSLDMESKGVFIGDQSLNNHDRNDTIHSLDMGSKGVFIGDQSLHNHDRNDTIHSLDMESKESLDKSNNEMPKSGKSFKLANDTNELLEMLSDFTDKPKSGNLDPLEEDEEIQNPVMVKGHLALEHKEKVCEPQLKRNSCVLRRQSIVLSREDLINNLSMAGAALQKSRFELDETDIEDTAKETPEPDVPRKKSVRMSTEVVKTLNFEEEVDSCHEISIQTDVIQTPLKKTAFGEISYMKETKARVIPDYLNVSDGIKELMDDLVKPMADVLPFNATVNTKSLKNCASTCSNQIQANLLTSSQIDLSSELYSNPESMYDIQKFSSIDIITDAVNRSVSRALKTPVKSTLTFTPSEKALQIVSHDSDARPAIGSVSYDTDIKPVQQKIIYTTNSPERRDPPERVLIFDHANPLNNVLLMPSLEAIEVHKYNPIQSTESISVSEKSAYTQVLDKDTEQDSSVDRVTDVDMVTTEYHIQRRDRHLVKNPGDSEQVDVRSHISDTSKLLSTDRSTDGTANEFKDTEVNTVIAMKGNKELLETISSLTLVDNALAQSTYDVDVDSRPMWSQEDQRVASPVKVLFKVEELPTQDLDSEFTSVEKLTPENKPVKSKKREYSPTRRERHKHCTLSMLDITPKPASKQPKHSHSPVHEQPTKLKAERDDPKCKTATTTRKKSPRKSKIRKPGTNVTIQQMTTMVHVESFSQDAASTVQSAIKSESVEKNPSNSSNIEMRSKTVSRTEVQGATVMTSSFTSSKNLKDDSRVTSPIGSNKSLRMEWAQDSSSRSSSKTPTECDSGVNLIDLIDMMPFMGSYDCEWECSSGETWSFRLLHSRLRLSVRFPRCPRVRPDTRVLDVALETIHQDKKNPLGTLCLKFAMETMRWFVARGCEWGADVPALVRRLAAAARLAAQWGRAMHDARARLAYTLTDDGWLALKVANTSLRCVWEVTMQLELVAEDPRAAPWPRAGTVRVTHVLLGAGAVPLSDADVRRALATTPRDWGHAPRTVWKIFKYLKHKKRDEGMSLQL